MQADQLMNMLEALPVQESLKTALMNRIESEGVTDTILDDVEQLLNDALTEVDQQMIAVAGEDVLLDEYQQQIEELIAEARQELERIDEAQDAILSGMEDVADQLEAQDAVDKA